MWRSVLFQSSTKRAILKTVSVSTKNVSTIRLASISMMSRSFTTTAPSFAKGKKDKDNKKGGKQQKSKGGQEEEVEFIDPKKILQDAEKELKSRVEDFDKRLRLAKLGTYNADSINSLPINLGDSAPTNLSNVAHAVVKGNLLTITVFDPKNTAKIRSAILASDLNMNPEQDPNNAQLLKATLPNIASKKAQIMKDVKNLTNLFKSTSEVNSLVNIRGRILKKLKNVGGSEDVVRKLTNDFGKIYQTYVKKIDDAVKQIENNLK